MFHLKRTICPLLVLATLASAGAAQGAAYYVAKTGNNANTCTQAQNAASPKLTIAAGLGCLTAGNGDTLIVGNGTYGECIDDQIPRGNNSWETATTVSAQNSRGVILIPPSTCQRVLHIRGAVSSPKYYIIVRGFVFDGINVSNDAVKFTKVDTDNELHHIRLQDCEVKNARGHAPSQQGILVLGAFHELLDNVVHDNGNSGLDHGIYLAQANNVLISGGEYYGHPGGGIQFASNPVHSNIIEKVYSHHNVYGILLADSQSQNILRNSLFINNSSRGINSLNTKGMKIYNNTSYGNTQIGINIEGSTDTALKNNISFGNGINIVISGSTGVINENNTTSNPFFVNAAAANFRLLSGSVAIDAGSALPEVKVDFVGTLRPQGVAYDIGAFEYGPASVWNVPPPNLNVQ